MGSMCGTPQAIESKKRILGAVLQEEAISSNKLSVSKTDDNISDSQRLINEQMKDDVQSQLNQYIKQLYNKTLTEGLQQYEIEALIWEANKLDDRMGDNNEDMVVILGDINTKIHNFNILRNQRSKEQEINIIIIRIDKAKKFYQKSDDNCQQQELKQLEIEVLDYQQSIQPIWIESERDTEEIKTTKNEEQKIRIQGFNLRLSEIESKIKEIKKSSIEKEIESIIVLINNHLQKFKNQEQKINKIYDATNKMNDSTSDQDDKQFYELLKISLDEILKNIIENSESLIDFTKQMQQIEQSRDIDMIYEISDRLETVQSMSEQYDELILDKSKFLHKKSLNKVCKCDEELDHSLYMMQDMVQQNKIEQHLIEKEQERVKYEIQTRCDDQELRVKFITLKENLIQYHRDLAGLNQQAISFYQKCKQVQYQFDEEIPNVVQEEKIDRRNRNRYEKQFQAMEEVYREQEIKILHEPNQTPFGMDYLIELNIKYRKQIDELKQKVYEITVNKLAIEEKYASLKDEVAGLQESDEYSPIRGDNVDELLALQINNRDQNINIARIDPSVYQIGGKQVKLFIKNTNLLVRVGSGFVDCKEYLDEYVNRRQISRQNSGSLSSVGEEIQSSTPTPTRPRLLKVSATGRNSGQGGSSPDQQDNTPYTPQKKITYSRVSSQRTLVPRNITELQTPVAYQACNIDESEQLRLQN